MNTTVTATKTVAFICNSQTALTLLDKINEANKKNVFDNMFNKKDRDKKKLVDTIYKQLKMKMAAPGSSVAND